MLSLVHLESPLHQYTAQYFVTITLPPSMNRKGPKKQKECLDRMLKRVGANYFEHARGAYEFTQKGNLHMHIVAEPRDMFPDIHFANEKAQQKATITMLKSALNQFSINDIQIIKNMKNIYEYINKDINVTEKILGSSPYILLEKKESKLHVLNVTVDKDMDLTCLDEINFYKGIQIKPSKQIKL